MDQEGVVQKFITQISKLFTLQRLGEDICNHFIGRLIFHTDFVVIDAVFDPEVSDIDVTSLVGFTGTPQLERHGTHVVLIYFGWRHIITLCNEEVTTPYDR